MRIDFVNVSHQLLKIVILSKEQFKEHIFLKCDLFTLWNHLITKEETKSRF